MIENSNIEDTREKSKMINTISSIVFPFALKGYKQSLIINFNSVNNFDLLSNKRSTSYFFNKADSKGYSVNLSTHFSSKFKTLFTIMKTELILPTTLGAQNSTWSGLGVSGNYLMLKNMLNVSGGISSFSVGTSHLYGIKIGCVYTLKNSVDIGLSGNFQLNYNPNSDDVWTWSSTSLILNAGYKF